MKHKWLGFPYIVWMGIFIIIPLFIVLYFSFTNESGEITLYNMIRISQYSPIFVRSMVLAMAATIICFVLAYPVAYILSRLTERIQRTMMFLLVLPMWMSFLLRTYGWMTLLENEGLINRFFGVMGIGPFRMINTGGAVVLGMVYNFLPFMILPLYAVMTKIDASFIEAAGDLGCNFMGVIRKVILPLSLPGIITGVIMVFVPSVSTFVISRMLGGGQNMLIGDLIEQQFVGSSYNPYLGSAMAMILMVIMLVIMGIVASLDDQEMEGIVV